MQDLVANGPLAVGIAVPDSFMDYRSGIYTADNDTTTKLRDFEPTAHAVWPHAYTSVGQFVSRVSHLK